MQFARMKPRDRWSHLLIVGSVLAYALPAQGQTPAAMVGTWELQSSYGNGKREFITVRPSGLWLSTKIDTIDFASLKGGKGDTAACTEKISDLEGTPEANRLRWYRIEGQELHENMGWGPTGDKVYKRVEDLFTGSVGHLVAAGYGLGHPVPVHAARQTGTMADLAGVWQADSAAEGGAEGKGIFRSTAIIHPDSTMLVVRLQKIGKGTDSVTIACGRIWSLGGWSRHGDSLYLGSPTESGGGGLIVADVTVPLMLLQSGWLDLYGRGGTWQQPYLYLHERYRPIDVPKRP